MRSQRTRRVVGLLAALGVALGLGSFPRAEAGTPCGYVKYKIGSGGSWHQVPYVPYCEPEDWCGGVGAHLPGQVTLVHHDIYVCVPEP